MDANLVTNYLLKIYNSDQSTNFVNELKNELQTLGLSHPSIDYQLNSILWENGNQQDILNKFKKIIKDEINNNFCTYDTIFCDSIGMSGAFLIKNYYIDKLSDFGYYDLFRISYYYLSNHIKNYGYRMYDSLKVRAILCDENNRLIQTLSNNKTNSLSVNPIPQILSDYYFASNGYQQNGLNYEAQTCINRSKEFYDFLSDMKVSGKFGADYSLSELAELGKERAEKISTQLNMDDIDISELIKILEQ